MKYLLNLYKEKKIKIIDLLFFQTLWFFFFFLNCYRILPIYMLFLFRLFDAAANKFVFIKIFDNAWMISGLKLSSTLPKVANKSWKQRQIKGDRWRPAKNPPMTKLVSLWFLFEGKVYRSSEWITLFVDQCFYSTPTEQSSPFM